MFQNTRKRSARRGWPIMGYVGPNGSGKSAAMVWDSLPSLEAGRPVLSTVRLLDYENPRECEGCDQPGHALPIYQDAADVPLPVVRANAWADDPETPAERKVIGYKVHPQAHPLWIPFTSWDQLLQAEHCDLLLDEVTGVASSRESMGMPAAVANTLVQMRRADVAVRWSAPSWSRADKIIRECSQAVAYCRGYLPVKAVDEDGERMWKNRRLFKWTTYDATQFEDFTVGKREQLSSLGVDWHWGPKSPVFAAYDTLDAVLSIGMVSDAGRCYTCAGNRRPHDCFCPDYVHRKDDAKSAAVAARARPEAEQAVPLPVPAVLSIPLPSELRVGHGRHVG